MSLDFKRIIVVSCDTPHAYTFSGERQGYAHPAVTGATLSEGRSVLDSWDDAERYDRYDDPMHISAFKLTSQLDNADRGNGMPYALRYGFSPMGRDTITAADIARYSKPIAAIERSLTKAAELDGAPASFGALVLRLARALKADVIVLMPTGDLRRDTVPLRQWQMSKSPGDAVWYIDRMISEAIKGCKVSAGEVPAESDAA